MEFLVKRAKGGDAEAFIELMEQNKQSMYRVAKGFLRNEEDVADAMAETVLTCYEKVRTLKQDAYFKTWMIRILINHCKNMRKTQKRSVPVETVEGLEEQASGDGMRGFKELIDPLGEQDQSIFTLYYVYGMKVKEIAAYMEMKENTVSTRLRRGRETLRGGMADSRKTGGR